LKGQDGDLNVALRSILGKYKVMTRSGKNCSGSCQTAVFAIDVIEVLMPMTGI
jgi:hypothetical protein